MVLDRFGITKLFPSVGREWFSNWDNGIRRNIKSGGIDKRNQDQQDPMVSFNCKSYSDEGHEFIVYGDGNAKIRGWHPRLYINKSTWEPLWNNVEMTCYARFTKPIIKSGTYTVFRLAARSNHQGHWKCACNGKGYATEIIINQTTLKSSSARYRKELIHPHYANANFNVGLIDMTKWVGMKFICRTINNNVVLQTYLDITNGYQGGLWNKVSEFVDTGSNWAIVEPIELKNIEYDISKCTSGCADSRPVKPYAEKILRRGASCYLRTDWIYDCFFKKFSIREI